jgi:hypothetical protein
MYPPFLRRRWAKAPLPVPNINYVFTGPAYPGATVINPAFGNGPSGTIYNPQGNLTYQNGNGVPYSTNIISGVNWGGSNATASLSGTPGPYSTNLALVTSTTATAGDGYWWQTTPSPLIGTNGSGPYFAVTWHAKRGNQPWCGVRQWSLQFPSQWSFYNFDTDTAYANGAYSFTRTLLANGIVRLTQIIQTYQGSVGYHLGIGPNAGPTGSGTVNVGDTVYVSDPQCEATLDPANYVTNFNYLPAAGANPAFNCRFDYDPVALTPRGWHIEEARTNYLRNSCCMAAVVGTPGTLPTNWSVVTTGGLTTNVFTAGVPSPNVLFENGVPCVDIQVTGTATGTSYQLAFEVNNNISSSNGQAWSHSAFLKLVGGSFANVTQLQLQTASYSNVPALLTTYTTNIANPTGSPLQQQRFGGSLTIADASVSYVRPGIGFTCSIGAAINFTIRIGLPQLENGGFVTSPIATWANAGTPSSLGRNADQCNMGSAFPGFWNASAGTVACVFMVEAVAGAIQFPYYLNGGTSNDELYTSIKSGNVDHSFSILGAGTTDMAGPAAAAMTLYKCAVGYAASNIRGAVNGAYTGAAQAATLRVGMNGGTFGYAGSNFLNGWVQSWSYYNTRLPDSQLLAITH